MLLKAECPVRVTLLLSLLLQLFSWTPLCKSTAHLSISQEAIVLPTYSWGDHVMRRRLDADERPCWKCLGRTLKRSSGAHCCVFSCASGSVFASLPFTERGMPIVLGGDPKGKNFLYTNGNSVIIRDIAVSFLFVCVLLCFDICGSCLKFCSVLFQRGIQLFVQPWALFSRTHPWPMCTLNTRLVYVWLSTPQVDFTSLLQVNGDVLLISRLGGFQTQRRPICFRFTNNISEFFLQITQAKSVSGTPSTRNTSWRTSFNLLVDQSKI